MVGHQTSPSKTQPQAIHGLKKPKTWPLPVFASGMTLLVVFIFNFLNGFSVLENTWLASLSLSLVVFSTLVLSATMGYRIGSRLGGPSFKACPDRHYEEEEATSQRRKFLQYHMLGSMAAGIAHNFNNIICAISGHADILAEKDGWSDDDQAALQIISHEAARGSEQATQLRNLATTPSNPSSMGTAGDWVRDSVELLRIGLSSQWKIELHTEEGFKTGPLSKTLFEQVLVNLGFLVTDKMEVPGVLDCWASPSDVDESSFEHEILICCREHRGGESAIKPEISVQTVAERPGWVERSVATMLDELGCRVERVSTPEGYPGFRIRLSGSPLCSWNLSADRHVPMNVRQNVMGWNILLAISQETKTLRRDLKELGLNVRTAGDVVETLHHLEDHDDFHAMIFDHEILGSEIECLIRAIRKLQPESGIVVLCEEPDDIPSYLKEDVYFTNGNTNGSSLLDILLQARVLAADGVGSRSVSTGGRSLPDPDLARGTG